MPISFYEEKMTTLRQ